MCVGLGSTGIFSITIVASLLAAKPVGQKFVFSPYYGLWNDFRQFVTIAPSLRIKDLIILGISLY